MDDVEAGINPLCLAHLGRIGLIASYAKADRLRDLALGTLLLDDDQAGKKPLLDFSPMVLGERWLWGARVQ